MHSSTRTQQFARRFLLSSDVAGRADNSIDTAVVASKRNAMLAGPMPRAVGMAIAVLAVDPIGFPFQVGTDRRSIPGHVVGMDPVRPIRHSLQLLAGQTD